MLTGQLKDIYGFWKDFWLEKEPNANIFIGNDVVDIGIGFANPKYDVITIKRTRHPEYVRLYHNNSGLHFDYFTTTIITGNGIGFLKPIIRLQTVYNNKEKLIQEIFCFVKSIDHSYESLVSRCSDIKDAND